MSAWKTGAGSSAVEDHGSKSEDRSGPRGRAEYEALKDRLRHLNPGLLRLRARVALEEGEETAGEPGEVDAYWLGFSEAYASLAIALTGEIDHELGHPTMRPASRLGQLLRRHAELAANPARTQDEQAAIEAIGRLLHQLGDPPGWPTEPQRQAPPTYDIPPGATFLRPDGELVAIPDGDLTAEQIAAVVGGRVTGDGQVEVRLEQPYSESRIEIVEDESLPPDVIEIHSGGGVIRVEGVGPAPMNRRVEIVEAPSTAAQVAQALAPILGGVAVGDTVRQNPQVEIPVAPRVVVAAIIARAGRVLLTQRLATKSYPHLWESPGGKVEPGETLREALARELREELAVELVDAEPVEVEGAYYLDAENRTQMREVLFFAADVIGEPKALAAAGLGWFDEAGLRALRDARLLTPGNEDAFEHIVVLLRASRGAS